MIKYQIILTLSIWLFGLLSAYLIAKEYTILYSITIVLTALSLYSKGYVDRCQKDLTDYSNKLKEFQERINNLIETKQNNSK